MKLKSLTLIFVVLSATNAEIRNYEGHKVYKVIPKNADEVESLINIKRSGVSEFWDDVFDVNHNVKMVVSGLLEAELIEMLTKAKIEAKVVIEDVQR